MIGRIEGAIWDVDDTLLNNQSDDGDPINNLHQRSRLVAIHTVARRYGVSCLLSVTAEENYGSFARSPVHTVSGALWVILVEAGLRSGDLSPKDPLLLEILNLKYEEYAKLLASEGKPVMGAVEFVRDLARHCNLEQHNAVASTATLADINVFFHMTGLKDLFPDSRIVHVDNITYPKPHPEAFDKAFLSLNLPESSRARVVAFEDDPRGIASAQEAGLIVCAITTRYSRAHLEGLEIVPDFIADSYNEFREIFGLSSLV